MKKFLCPLLCLTILFSSLRSASQCVVSNIIIQNVSVAGTQAPGTCTVKFDASFTIENNNGNKYIFIHAWLQQDYPDYFHCVDGHPSNNGSIAAPDAGDLGNEFLTIGINNDIVPPQLLTTYTPDPTVPITHVDAIEREVLADGSAVFILKGVTTTLPITCGIPSVIVADVWSSQSAQAQRAHCVNCGILFSAGMMGAAGLVNCATLTYNATLTNNTALAISGYYRVYADVNGDAYFTPSIDTLIQDTTAFSLGAGVGTTASISGPVPLANLNQNLFLLVTQTSGAASGASRVVFLPSTTCAPLPVTLNTFTATRTSYSAVSLRWQTVTEINNKGFVLERNKGNNSWEALAFVPSQASGGNSDNALNYNYTDANNTNKGITQYRLRQVDIDGKATISPIRAVRGFGQNSGTIIYPNPSSDGSVNVVFDRDEDKHDLTLTDMSGRVIKQWTSVTGNTLHIDNLRKGMYLLRIVETSTGTQTVEKLMISREEP